jgi:phytoene/squalene synthetase
MSPGISPSAGFTFRRFGYPDADLEAQRFTPAFADLLRFEVERTRGLFEQGRPLVKLVPGDVQKDIALFIEGGMAILRKIAAQGYNVWDVRPALAKWEKAALVGRVWLRQLSGAVI